MKYNFDEVIDRSNNRSSKYDERLKKFGTEDVIPLWVADMDFKTAQPIIDALKKKAEEGIHYGVFREAVMVQMTWPGAPTVYYGDEAGVCGFTDPDNRRTYPWGHEDQMMIAFHRDMIKIHKEYDFLSNGSLVFLWNDYQGLCFGRFSHDERMIVILNNRNEDREVEIEVWKTGISRLKDSVLKRIMLSYRDGYTTEEYEYTAKAGVIRVPMPAFGAMVLYHKCENPTIFVED